jgi:hypothetical protein
MVQFCARVCSSSRVFSVVGVRVNRNTRRALHEVMVCTREDKQTHADDDGSGYRGDVGVVSRG